MVTLVAKIYSNFGIKSTELQEALNVSERTTTSDINRLEDFIEYRGSKKTERYFLKDTVRVPKNRDFFMSINLNVKLQFSTFQFRGPLHNLFYNLRKQCNITHERSDILVQTQSNYFGQKVGPLIFYLGRYCT